LKLNKRINFLTFLCTVLILIFIPDQLFANEQQETNITTGDNSVKVEITTTGDYYKIFKNDELIYEGESNTFKDKLTDDIQKYKIGVFEKKKIKKIIKLNINKPMGNQLTTNSNNTKGLEAKAMEKAINSSMLETTASNKSVTLKWDKLPDEDNIYEVFKNEKKIGETKKLAFTDKNITPEREYKYTIKAKINRSQQDVQKATRKIMQNKIKLTQEETNEIFSIHGELSTFITIPKNNELELEESEELFNQEDKIKTNALPKDNAYSFIYRTFIPYKSVKDPLKGGYLKGDNRSYASNSNKFRSETIQSVQFSQPTFAKQWKKVGKSHRCKDANCKNVIESGTANSNGIQSSVNILKSNRIQWTVRHSASVPFSPLYPKSDYQYFADLKKYTVFLSGSHDGAPNHEFYVFNMNGSSRFIHSYSIKSKNDFWKLLDLGLGNFWRLNI